MRSDENKNEPKKPFSSAKVALEIVFGVLGGGVIFFGILLAILVLMSLISMEGPKTPSHESSAIGSVRTIVTAQQQFRILKRAVNEQGEPRYAVFTELVEHKMIDETFVENYKSGYNFTLDLARSGQSFTVYASPVSEEEGYRMFYTDETGRLTFSTQGLPDRNSAGVD